MSIIPPKFYSLFVGKCDRIFDVIKVFIYFLSSRLKLNSVSNFTALVLKKAYISMSSFAFTKNIPVYSILASAYNTKIRSSIVCFVSIYMIYDFVRERLSSFATHHYFVGKKYSSSMLFIVLSRLYNALRSDDVSFCDMPFVRGKKVNIFKIKFYNISQIHKSPVTLVPHGFQGVF